MKQLLLQKEQEAHLLAQKVEELRRAKVNSKNLFDGNELFSTFQAALNDRNEAIAKLKAEVAGLKNTQFIAKIEPKTSFRQPATSEAQLMVSASKQAFWTNERDNWLVQEYQL